MIHFFIIHKLVIPALIFKKANNYRKNTGYFDLLSKQNVNAPLITNLKLFFYLFYNHQVTEFGGDIDDYYRGLNQKNPRSGVIQQAAMINIAKKNLQNRMKKLDQLNETYQKNGRN